MIGFTSSVTKISAGYSHTCALDSSDASMCWGDNFLSKLGDGPFANSYSTTAIDTNYLTSGIAATSARGDHSCVLTMPAGGAKCWGSYGGLGQTIFTMTTANAFSGAAYARYVIVSTSIGPMAILRANLGQCTLPPPPYPQCTLSGGSGTSDDPYNYSCSSALPLACTGGGAPLVLAGGQVNVDALFLNVVPQDVIFADGFDG